MLTNYSWFQIHKHSARDMLSSSRLAEEGVEGIVSTADALVGRHLAVWLDAMLQTVEFPAGVADLDTSLSNMDRDTLTLQGKQKQSICVHAAAPQLQSSCIFTIFLDFRSC